MIDKEKLLKSLATAFLALLSTQTNSATSDEAQATEKCYGVAKAGRNDCNTARASCAGSSTKNNQSDAFLLMPKGLCEKLVGGQLKPNEATLPDKMVKSEKH